MNNERIIDGVLCRETDGQWEPLTAKELSRLYLGEKAVVETLSLMARERKQDVKEDKPSPLNLLRERRSADRDVECLETAAKSESWQPGGSGRKARKMIDTREKSPSTHIADCLRLNPPLNAPERGAETRT